MIGSASGAIATASSKSSRHPSRPNPQRAIPRHINATATSGDRGTAGLSLAESPSAHSMTVYNHRRTSVIWPVSYSTEISTVGAPMIEVGSSMVSSSAICSEASRYASRMRP